MNESFYQSGDALPCLWSFRRPIQKYLMPLESKLMNIEDRNITLSDLTDYIKNTWINVFWNPSDWAVSEQTMM